MTELAVEAAPTAEDAVEEAIPVLEDLFTDFEGGAADADITDDDEDDDGGNGRGNSEPFRVVVSPPLPVVTARLRAGGRALMPIARRRIRIATAPAIPMIRQSAMQTLPSGGGLNQWVASASYRTSVLFGPKTAGVSIRGTKKGHDLVSIDRGLIHHPVYGNRNTWATTQVQPGYFTRPMERIARQVRAESLTIMREVSEIAGFKFK